ncbi:hypothetical protein H696_00555 [Fonticula alba]|uniref:PH domain-containing protein n=1 Tax=Fonticula alba TaxID=691883 RepID=A0A058ZF45_FONAL|nr:hypothetical protein H696_00555 [Fonticula alba]KCV73005.1 hypothetical protein H696_00555 [Fonticula alba]|eukprot:XP_009492706.1 hypothetical protein H696_00555 [Fonticula alba]
MTGPGPTGLAVTALSSPPSWRVSQSTLSRSLERLLLRSSPEDGSTGPDASLLLQSLQTAESILIFIRDMEWRVSTGSFPAEAAAAYAAAAAISQGDEPAERPASATGVTLPADLLAIRPGTAQSPSRPDRPPPSLAEDYIVLSCAGFKRQYRLLPVPLGFALIPTEYAQATGPKPDMVLLSPQSRIQADAGASRFTDQDSVLCGWMEKQGDTNKKFRRRWFTLSMETGLFSYHRAPARMGDYHSIYASLEDRPADLGGSKRRTSGSWAAMAASSPGNGPASGGASPTDWNLLEADGLLCRGCTRSPKIASLYTRLLTTEFMLPAVALLTCAGSEGLSQPSGPITRHHTKALSGSGTSGSGASASEKPLADDAADHIPQTVLSHDTSSLRTIDVSNVLSVRQGYLPDLRQRAGQIGGFGPGGQVSRREMLQAETRLYQEAFLSAGTAAISIQPVDSAANLLPRLPVSTSPSFGDLFDMMDPRDTAGRSGNTGGEGDLTAVDADRRTPSPVCFDGDEEDGGHCLPLSGETFLDDTDGSSDEMPDMPHGGSSSAALTVPAREEPPLQHRHLYLFIETPGRVFVLHAPSPSAHAVWYSALMNVIASKETPIYSGWLFKRSKYGWGWKKRWAVLRGRQAFFYRQIDKTHVGQLRSRVELRTCTLAEGLPSGPTGRAHQFRLVFQDGRQLILAAPCAASRRDWLSAITYHPSYRPNHFSVIEGEYY